MPAYVWLYIFHPILVTLLALPVLVLLLRWTGLWARFRFHIVVALLAAYAIDAALALPRIVFSHGLAKEPAITQHPPLPRRIVMVGVPCFAKCHDWLISGAVEEIVVIRPASPQAGRMATSAERYRAAWVQPKSCPHERRKANFLPSGCSRKPATVRWSIPSRCRPKEPSWSWKAWSSGPTKLRGRTRRPI